MPRLHAIIEEFGLASLRMQLSYRYIDRALVLTYVERWQLETNTFHLPFGEITITLDDVSAIISISVVGTPVHALTSLSFTDHISLLDVDWEWIEGLSTQVVLGSRWGS